MMRLVSTVALASALAACGLEPDVGAVLAGTCSELDSDPAASVSFSQQIRPLLNRPGNTGGCNCHMPGPGGIAIALSGLNLSSLSSLRAGGLNSGARIVTPMEPCASILYLKVSDAPPFGSRMPLGGPPFLSPDEIRQLHDWIAEGALDN